MSISLAQEWFSIQSWNAVPHSYPLWQERRYRKVGRLKGNYSASGKLRKSKNYLKGIDMYNKYLSLTKKFKIFQTSRYIVEILVFTPIKAIKSMCVSQDKVKRQRNRNNMRSFFNHIGKSFGYSFKTVCFKKIILFS